MATDFSVLDNKRTIVITSEGSIDAAELGRLRQRSAELIEETGYTDFIVDIRKVTSIEEGKTFAIVEVGESYSDFRITVWSNTAVLLPADESVREQVDLMCTIEINRGRGVINYVDSFEEAFSWFEEMARRA
jgi:hypothetical protein